MQEGQGPEAPHNHTRAGYLASGLNSAAPRENAVLPSTQAHLV